MEVCSAPLREEANLPLPLPVESRGPERARIRSIEVHMPTYLSLVESESNLRGRGGSRNGSEEKVEGTSGASDTRTCRSARVGRGAHIGKGRSVSGGKGGEGGKRGSRGDIGVSASGPAQSARKATGNERGRRKKQTKQAQVRQRANAVKLRCIEVHYLYM